MDPSAILALGALIASAGAVILNLYSAYQVRRKETIGSSAALVEAEAQMRIGSIQATQKLIDMYGEMLVELKERVKVLETRVQELERENAFLKSRQNGYNPKDDEGR